MCLLVAAILHLDLIDTYANGRYDDSHEWECECDEEGGPFCECRDYDLDGRDDDEHDLQMAEEHGETLATDEIERILAAHADMLTFEADDRADLAQEIADDLRDALDDERREREDRAQAAARKKPLGTPIDWDAVRLQAADADRLRRMGVAAPVPAAMMRRAA